MSRATLPRAQAPVAGNIPPAMEWYRYWSDVAITADIVPVLKSEIATLGARVDEIEQESINPAAVRGFDSVSAIGSLNSTVAIRLQGDIASLPAWHYYGTSPDDGTRTFHEFPENLQALSSLSGAGFPLRELDGTWGQYTLGGRNGIVIGLDGSVVTISGNPYFAAIDDPTGDLPQGPAIATHEQSVALGSGTVTDGSFQVNIGPRSIRINGHTLSATPTGLLYDGSPIGGGGGGGGSGNSYMPGGW